MFYDLGWRGINLEPSPAHHAAFVRRRPRDVNLCAAAAAPGRRIEALEHAPTARDGALKALLRRFGR